MGFEPASGLIIGPLLVPSLSTFARLVPKFSGFLCTPLLPRFVMITDGFSLLADQARPKLYMLICSLYLCLCSLPLWMSTVGLLMVWSFKSSLQHTLGKLSGQDLLLRIGLPLFGSKEPLLSMLSKCGLHTLIGCQQDLGWQLEAWIFHPLAASAVRMLKPGTTCFSLGTRLLHGPRSRLLLCLLFFAS